MSIKRDLPSFAGVIGLGVLLFEVYVGAVEAFTGRDLFIFPNGTGLLTYGDTANAQGIAARATGTFPHPEPYAAFAGIVALFLMGYWWHRRRHVRSIVAFISGFAAISFSGERGILIAFILSTLFVLLKPGRNRLSRFLVFCIGGSLVGAEILSLIASSPTIQERINNSGNIYTRLASFKAAFEIFGDHPLLGVGFGGYTRVASEAQYQTVVSGYPSVPFPHNTFLSFAAETGIIGIVLYTAFWFAIITNLRQALNLSGRRLAIGLVAFMGLASLSLNLGVDPTLVVPVIVLGSIAAQFELNNDEF